MEKNFYKRNTVMSCCRMVVLICAIFWSFVAQADVQQGKGKPERLENYLKKIEQTYKVSFVYDSEEISKAMILDVPEKLGSIAESLEPLKQKNIGYKQVGNQVILKVENTPEKAAKRDVTVRGVVKDKKDGQPMPGVTVSVKGTNVIASTNEKGEYQIAAKDAASILVFRYLGYKTVEVTVGARTSINVDLEEDANQLREVNVVSTGYQTLEKKTFSGASTLIKATDAERAGVTDVSRMLEGQVAGVTIQNVSGTFGAAPKIRVRGATSFSGDNKPLWVVDGIILEDVINISNEALTTGDANTLIGSSVAGLNPDDIESFNILKDAAATGMYGARAMNGVIVVTTKKGRQTQGKPAISYRGNFTTYAKPTYADFDVMNSADQMAVLIEMQNKGYYQVPTASRGVSGGPFYKMYNRTYELDANGNFLLRNDDASRIAFLTRYANANTDWFDVLFKNSLQQEHSLSINSGTDKFKSYASTSFTKDNGVTIGNSVERFTGNYRANFNISEKLSAELLSTGSIRNQKTPGATSLQQDVVYGNYFRNFDINPYSYALNTSRMLTPYDENGNLEYFRQNSAPFSILNELNTNYLDLGQIDFKVQGNLSYKILPSLSYSVDGAYRFVKTETQISILESSNMATSYRLVDDATSAQANGNLYTDPDLPGSLPMSVLPSGGFYKTSGDNLKTYYFRQNLNFNKTFNTDHNISAFGAMEVRFINRQRESFDGVGYQFDNGGLVSPYYKYFKEAAEEGKPYFSMGRGYERYTAFFGNAAYTFKEKYTLRLSGRYDGSNLLGKDATARWLPTWNVSASWNISDENFWPKSDILYGAKLRGSYGLVASIGNATNSSAVFYNQISRRPALNDQEALIYISNLENSELTWEKTKDLNIGLDLALLKGRINFTVDLYKRNIFDLIGSIQTSGIGGEYTKIANYGAMSGKGLELAIMGRAIDNKDFKWTTNFNFGFNKNSVTTLDINPNVFRSVSANGAPVVNYPQRSLFSIQFAGLNHDYGYPMFIGTVDGRPTTYVYLQGDELLNLKYEGPLDPTFAGGFYNQFTYKNLTLSTLLGFSAGNMIRLNPNMKSSFDDLSSMSRDVLNRWVMPGDEQFTNVPAIMDVSSASRIVDANGSAVDIRYPYNLYNFSTERVAHGDYIKLRQVSLSYNLPKNIASKVGATNASISVVGNNLLLLYSDKRLNGQDPEFYATGGVALPVSRQYTLSLRVGF